MCSVLHFPPLACVEPPPTPPPPLPSAGRGIWIVKPTNASCGRGITVEASLVDVAAAVALLEHSAIVQKYVWWWWWF